MTAAEKRRRREERRRRRDREREARRRLKKHAKDVEIAEAEVDQHAQIGSVSGILNVPVQIAVQVGVADAENIKHNNDTNISKTL